MSSKFLLCVLCCFLQHNVISAPLNIDINQGIEATPHQTGDVDKSISSSFVQTIEAAEFRDSQLDLTQIIENSSGIKIRRLGGFGSYSQISIRGKSADQIMIYVDGMPINSALGGSVDLSQIPTNQITRIEIYKDVIPTEFSEASNGGVINIITHRIKKFKSTQLSGVVGSFETFNLGFNHFNHYNDWQFVLSGGYVTSKNNFLFTYNNATPNNPFDDEIQNRKNNQLNQYNIAAKAKYKIDHNKSLQLQSELFNKNKHIPSYSNNSDTKTSLIYNNHLFNINYIDKHPGIDNLELNIGINATKKETYYDDRNGDIGFDKDVTDQTLQAVSIKSFIKYKNIDFQVVNSSSLRFESLDIDETQFIPIENDTEQLRYSKSNHRTTLSTALEGHFYFQHKKLIISPASRFLISHDEFNGETLRETTDKLKLNKNYHTISPQIGLRFQLWQNTNLKFNAGKYYRLPNYVELFGTRGFIGSNESLSPEKGLNFDAGFEHLSYLSSETLTKLSWNASLYHSIINNEIAYSFDARGIGKPSNNNKSTITGIENNINMEFNYKYELISNTTLQAPLNRSDPDNIKLLVGRPFLTQNTRLVINQDPLEIFVEHIWESFYYFDTEQELLNEAKSVFNTGFKMRSKTMQYSLLLNNLFNKQFKDYYSQVSPGFSIFLSITLKFN